MSNHMYLERPVNHIYAETKERKESAKTIKTISASFFSIQINTRMITLQKSHKNIGHKIPSLSVDTFWTKNYNCAVIIKINQAKAIIYAILNPLKNRMNRNKIEQGLIFISIP